MDRAANKIRTSLAGLVREYEKVSVAIGEPSVSIDSDKINQIIRTRYNPREHWGKSPDNATIAGDRKLATRIFNFVAALGSIPSLAGQVYLALVLFPLIGGAGAAAIGLPLFFLNAIMLFSAFTYLSHLYANLANLHDVQAEEFVDHLSRVEGIIQIKPRAEFFPQAKIPPTVSLSPPKRETLTRLAAPAPESTPPPPATRRSMRPLFPPQAATEEDTRNIPLTQWQVWQADDAIAAIVIFVTKDNEEKEEKFLTSFAGKHRLTKINSDDIETGQDLQVRMREIQAEVLEGPQDLRKIIFLEADTTGGYVSIQQKDIVLTEDEPKVLADSKVKNPTLSLEDLIRELEAPVKTPGFQAVVVAVNEADADALRPVIKAFIQEKYGYNVPVAVIGVPGVSGGNGMPALFSFTSQRQVEEELRQDVPGLLPLDQLKVLTLEAYGPDFDIANLTAGGSTLFSSTGVYDRYGRAVTTGALALARGAITMREALPGAQYRFKTDTYNLNQIQSTVAGDVVFSVTLLPAKEVIGRFGVPVFSTRDPTKITGFFEKVGSFDKLKYIYKLKKIQDGKATTQEIQPDTFIPVFTGDVAFHFQEKEKQEAFQELVEFTARFFDSAVKTYPKFEFDEVLDFWVPLIMMSKKPPQSMGMQDVLSGYSGFRAKVSSTGERNGQERINANSVYTELYYKLLDKKQQLGLNITIAGSVDNAEFKDVRDVEPLASLNVSNAKASAARSAYLSHPAVLSSQKDQSDEVTTFGLNGNKPTTKLKGLLMAAAPMRSGQDTFEAIIYGMRGNWDVDRLNGFEESHLGFNTALFVDDLGDSFLKGIPFKQMPLFPTRLSRPEQANRLVDIAAHLSQGKRVHVRGGLGGLRKAGYVSLEDILRGRDFRGIEAPIHKYQVEGPANRSEMRTLTGLVRSGAAVAAMIIFLGILPAQAGFAAGKLQVYSEIIVRRAFEADLQLQALIYAGEAEKIPAVQVSPQHTLFVDGNLVMRRETLSGLKKLALSQFGIELLFTDRAQYEEARRAAGGTRLGSLRIRLGATAGEMIYESASNQVRENPEMKKSFAFLGTSDSAVRRVRAHVANLMVLKDAQLIPAEMLLEALLSPAVFSLNFKPNKIWSLDSALPMLLAARQIARSA